MTNNRQFIEKTTKTVSDISIKGDGRVILIENILQHLNRILGEAESLISKYDPESNSASQSSSRSRDKFMGYMSKKTRPTKWAVGDKASLEDLVQKLHKLNDGLEEQLPRLLLPRLRLGFATSQILPAGTEQLRSIQDAALHAGYGILSKGAAVRLACLSQEVASTKITNDMALDFQIQSSDVKIPPVPEGSLRYMTGFMQSRSMDVLMERRRAFQTTLPSAAANRLNKLVHVLKSMHADPRELEWCRDTNSMLMNFGVLHCVGWITPDNQNFDTIDLVFSYPSNTRGPPVSMHTFLQLRLEKRIPRNLLVWIRPPLGTRFNLALSLARIYANFIAVDYLHRGINSHNILFFADNINRPYLVGVAEARPGQIPHQSSQLSTEYVDRELYWPWCTVTRESSTEPSTDTWCTATDLYGLGVVLVEIGHWRTASQLCGDASVREFHQTLLPRAVDKLDYLMGGLYQGVVKWCFNAERDVSALQMYNQYSANLLAHLERCCA
ncbi:hypothetical protein PENSTE_c011G00396 [Penicillium steckii]|uniref:Prion-inhibition and propagation HeLo domain-containing protein n=1 Tax=Penicillium steckii TaxID=303698 RepID=A0A1V6T679_9EURO|nr:hypothetical protein PENSTE_c011G00396 [Penicillium steckii]